MVPAQEGSHDGGSGGNFDHWIQTHGANRQELPLSDSSIPRDDPRAGNPVLMKVISQDPHPFVDYQ